MSLLIRILESITRFSGYFAAVLVLPLTAIMVFEVVARYVFHAPTTWVFEMSYMLMGTLFLLGIALTMQVHAHVRVDFIYANLGDRWRALIDLLSALAMLAIVLITIDGLWEYLMTAIKRNEHSGASAWNPVVWPFRAIFLIGFGLFAMQLLAELIKCAYVLAGKTAPGVQPECVQDV